MVPNYVLPEWCGGWNKDLRFTGFVIRPTSPWLRRGCGRLPKKRLPIIPKRSFTSIIRSASILLAVATPHSAEAFAVSQTLLRRLKLEVPIWKKPIEALDCP